MVTKVKDGSTWRIGTSAEVAWIADGTSTGIAITAAVPAVFEAYPRSNCPTEARGRTTMTAPYSCC
jgi:hypothetical protein